MKRMRRIGYGIGVLLLIALVIGIAGIRKEGDVSGKVMVEVGEKKTEMELSEYLAHKALEMVDGESGLPESMMEAVYIVLHTDAWYRLQRGYPLQLERRYAEADAECWTEVIAAVKDCILIYDGEPIFAAWYKCGAGVTSSASEWYRVELPYLQRVESYDMEADCLRELTFSKSEAEKKLEGAADSMRVIRRAESGAVLRILVGDREMSGSEFAKRMGLPSVIFTFRWEQDQLTLSCFGSGEPVGMSLYGANKMAQDGKTSRQILAYFYPDSNLRRILLDSLE